MTRTNPKMRNFPLDNENVSLAKQFTVSSNIGAPSICGLKASTQFATPNNNLNDAANFRLGAGSGQRATRHAIRRKAELVDQ